MSIFSRFKLRIGAKLAITSGLGVFLVGGMLASQMIGNGSVVRANEDALSQILMTQEVTDIKASVRGMMVGIRDVRLAQRAEDVQKAMAYLDARLASIERFVA